VPTRHAPRSLGQGRTSPLHILAESHRTPKSRYCKSCYSPTHWVLSARVCVLCSLRWKNRYVSFVRMRAALPLRKEMMLVMMPVVRRVGYQREPLVLTRTENQCICLVNNKSNSRIVTALKRQTRLSVTKAMGQEKLLIAPKIRNPERSETRSARIERKKESRKGRMWILLAMVKCRARQSNRVESVAMRILRRKRHLLHLFAL
jgi:hypothetical protein